MSWGMGPGSTNACVAGPAAAGAGYGGGVAARMGPPTGSSGGSQLGRRGRPSISPSSHLHTAYTNVAVAPRKPSTAVFDDDDIACQARAGNGLRHHTHTSVQTDEQHDQPKAARAAGSLKIGCARQAPCTHQRKTTTKAETWCNEGGRRVVDKGGKGGCGGHRR